MPLSDVRTWARARARRLPGVAWRDARIRELTAALTRVEKDLAAQRSGKADTPSFARYIYADRRINDHLLDSNLPDRADQMEHKLESVSFAQSHGIRIPRVLGLWERPDDIPWEGLPDEIVLKSNSGASSRGVYPMRRIDGRWTVVTRDEPIEPAEIVARLTELQRIGRIGGPFFGQELIGAGRENILPTEVRVFCFYGEVGLVNVRRVASHADKASVRVRRFLEDGTPGPRHPLHDDDIVPPDIFEEAVEIGRQYSTLVPRPFIRMDFLDDHGDLVFGELTPRPGGPHYFGPEHDLRLGVLWEHARARFLHDLTNGQDYALTYGDGPRELDIGDRQYLPEHGWVAP